MIIRVSDIQADGLLVANPGEFPAPFAERSWRLEAVRLRLALDGPDVLIAGEIAAEVPLTCSRCLEGFSTHVRAVVDVRYVPRPPALGRGEGIELGPDDLDLDFYENDELDLAALVETETTLALPMKPLCREDCRGLCPACGANRNLVACTCQAAPPDPRWATLKDLAARLSR